jgi:hypothetical protein
MAYDDEFPDENFFPDTNGEPNPQEQEFAMEVELAHINLTQLDLNQKLLAKVIKLLQENVWFWKFKRFETKLRMIIETYFLMKKVVMDELGEEEGEEG